MLKLKAIKSNGFVEEGKEYFFGAMMYKNSDALLMTVPDKELVPGKYDSVEVFGLTKDQIFEMIRKDH